MIELAPLLYTQFRIKATELSISKLNKLYGLCIFQATKEVITYAGRSHPAHRCPLCGGHQAISRDAAAGHEKGAGRDAERSDWPQDQTAPRQADPPAADEAQHRRFQHRLCIMRI